MKNICNHSFNLFVYLFQSGVKLFSIGCGLQMCLKLFLQMNRLMKKPKVVFYSVFQLNTLRLGAFFAGFGGLFRVRHDLNFFF